MVWKAFPLLLAGNNKLLFADHSNASLDQFNRDAQSSVVLRLSFNLSGIDPSAATTTGTSFTLTFHIFPTSLAGSWYFSWFSSSFSLTLTSSGIAATIICWWWWQWFNVTAATLFLFFSWISYHYRVSHLMVNQKKLYLPSHLMNWIRLIKKLCR